MVAVDQDHRDREHQDLAEGPQHVTGRQELVEVVVVGSGALAEELGERQPGGEVRRQQPDDVQRDHRDQAADDACGDQERQGRDRHDLEGVDLLGDAHRAELRGETAADGRRQCDAGDQRGDLAGVEVGGEEAGERGGADLVQRRVALQADLGAGEEAHGEDDADGAADDGQGAGAQRHLGEDPQDLLLVAHQGARGPRERAHVERQLLTEGVHQLQRTLVGRLEVRHARQPVFGGTSCR